METVNSLMNPMNQVTLLRQTLPPLRAFLNDGVEPMLGITGNLARFQPDETEQIKGRSPRHEKSKLPLITTQAKLRQTKII